MEILLFFIYLFLFVWLVTRVGLYRDSGLTTAQLRIVFLLKIIAGIFYGWVGIYYQTFAYMYDTWGYHNASVLEQKLLFTDPAAYFTNLFTSGYDSGYGRLFASSDSYWNDLKSNVLIKILSVFDVFSFGNYFVNVIFYNFLTLAGPVMLFRILNDIYPGKRIALLIGCFLLPSFLYWTSGIHKDGLVFTLMILIFYQLYFGLKNGNRGWKRWALIGFSCLFLLAIRNYVLLLLVPAVIGWILTVKTRRSPLRVFAVIYGISFLLFFGLKYIHPALDFPQAVVNKQTAFMQLEGGSGIRLNKLEPHVGSFIKNTPQALLNSTLRPFPFRVQSVLILGVVLEDVFFFALAFLFFVFPDPSLPRRQVFFIACLFFSFSLLLTIGFTVNFQGAIVRYRSIVIPLLMAPTLVKTDWKRFLALANIYIKKY